MTLKPKSNGRGNWQNAINPNLTGRLMRTLTQPGVAGNRLSSDIIARTLHMTTGIGKTVTHPQQNQFAESFPPEGFDLPYLQRMTGNERLGQTGKDLRLQGFSNVTARNIQRKPESVKPSPGQSVQAGRHLHTRASGNSKESGIDLSSAAGIKALSTSYPPNPTIANSSPESSIQRRISPDKADPSAGNEKKQGLKAPKSLKSQTPGISDRAQAAAPLLRVVQRQTNQDVHGLFEKPIVRRRLEKSDGTSGETATPAKVDKPVTVGRLAKPLSPIITGKPIVQRRRQQSGRSSKSEPANPAGLSSFNTPVKSSRDMTTHSLPAEAAVQRSTKPTPLNSQNSQSPNPLPLVSSLAKSDLTNIKRAVNSNSQSALENHTGESAADRHSDPGWAIHHRHLNMGFSQPIQRRQAPINMVLLQEKNSLASPTVNSSSDSTGGSGPLARQIQFPYSPLAEHRTMPLTKWPEATIQRSTDDSISAPRSIFPDGTQSFMPVSSNSSNSNAITVQTKPDDLSADISQPTALASSVDMPDVSRSRTASEVDVTRIADQVYHILLNRLATERERRGL